MSSERDSIKVYLSKDLKEKVKAKAKEQDISLSTYVVFALKEYYGKPNTKTKKDKQ